MVGGPLGSSRASDDGVDEQPTALATTTGRGRTAHPVNSRRIGRNITMNERIRGRAGQRLRLRRLRAEPLCRDCAARGVIRRSTVPDHIRPLALGGLDVDENVRCLCDDCHLFRTAQQFGHRGGRLLGDDGWPIE